MKFDVKSIILNMVLPLLLSQGAAALGAWLDKFATEQPEWHKTVIIVAYRLLSVHGAEIVADTTNVYDDAAVSATVNELKANADKHGITV